MAVDEFIEEQLRLWEVPGCAAAAVKSGEVFINRGFGVRSLGNGDPVTTRTLFGIGSTTKAFTASAVGAMVDDGLIEWDEPIREYIPDFQMHDQVATARITPRDLLCHRTGLPRHELAWIGFPERSRADLARRVRHLPLSKDIRQSFQYCNWGYLIAGYLIEVVTGMSWEDYLSSRLLKPVGMDRTNFSIAEMTRSDDFSHAHERRNGKVIEIPFREFDAMGPIGSLNSCADDMLRWLQVNLGEGRVEDRQVISPDTLVRMRAPHVAYPEDATFEEVSWFSYGLGWEIGQYRGRRIVTHGGFVDGFPTELMTLPREGIGVVVLSNSSSSLMSTVIAYRIIDELLGEEPIDWFTRLKERWDALQAGTKEARAERIKVADAPLPRALEEYAGDYEHPGYGVFSVKVEGGTLRPTFGNLNMTLSHRHFEVFDLEWHELSEDFHVMPLTFLTAPQGDIMALTIPFEPTTDPIRFDRQPDPRSTDPKFLEALTGTYSLGPIDFVVRLKADRVLTAGTAGNPAVDLVPLRGLLFSWKGQPGVTFQFVQDGQGSVQKLVIHPIGVLEPKK